MSTHRLCSKISVFWIFCGRFVYVSAPLFELFCWAFGMHSQLRILVSYPSMCPPSRFCQVIDGIGSSGIRWINAEHRQKDIEDNFGRLRESASFSVAMLWRWFAASWISTVATWHAGDKIFCFS